jgi:molecular chaperone GrpE
MTSNSSHQAHDINGDVEDKQDVTPDGEEVSANRTSQIEALKADLAAMEERWMRSEAEIANVRTRAKRDVEEARQFALQKFAADLVDTAENLKRGLNSLPPATESEPKSISGLRAGLAGIERGFIDTLQKNGVTAMDPTGTVFAPEQHQAVGAREAYDHVSGTVLQSLSPVWMLNGRLLRPAMVIVAKEPAAPTTGTPYPADKQAQ